MALLAGLLSLASEEVEHSRRNTWGGGQGGGFYGWKQLNNIYFQEGVGQRSLDISRIMLLRDKLAERPSGSDIYI